MNLRLPSNERLTYYAIMLFGLICLALMSSCGTTKQIRRANRAAKKLDKLTERFPELMRPDTIRDTVLFTIPETKVDTVVLKADTIEINKDRWRVRIVTKLDSVYVSGGCDTLTVQVPIEIPVDRVGPTVYKDIPLKWWQVALMVLGVFFVAQHLFWIAVGRISR